MAWARPSELHRALQCPASCVLPRVPEDPKEKKRTAGWGKELHSWKETGVPPTPRIAKWLGELPRDPDEIRTELWPGGTHEVMLRMEESGEVWAEQASSEERRKSFFEGGWMRGIADWITEQGPVDHINDLKTGRFPPEDPPSKLPQKLWYADVWFRLRTALPGLLLSITHWPRYPKGCEPTLIGPDYVTKKDVVAWHNEQLIPAYLLTQKPNAKEDARPGTWCQYCPSAPFCPAMGNPV